MIVAIVQARMGSTRMPGKALLDIEGKCMLDRVLDRLARAKTLDRTIVATTINVQDDAIEAHCQKRGILVHRGSEHDVLARYWHAAQEAKASVVVRVTSDCPFIDPQIVDHVVTKLDGADYAANVVGPRTYPRGLDVEAFTISALSRAAREDQSSWREHVTPYMYRSGKFQCVSVRNAIDLSHHRWTVDTPEDMLLARTVYRHFGHDRFLLDDLLAAWVPEWSELNDKITQKGL